MRSATAEQRPRALCCERAPRKSLRGAKSGEAEAAEYERMAWDRHERSQHRLFQRVPGAQDRFHEPPVRARILPQLCSRLLDRAVEHDGTPVVERVRDGGRRVDELETVLGEGHGAEEGRAGNEGIDGRADVVDETRQRQLGGADSAADRVLSLANEDRAPGARERNRGREPVGPGADDNRIVGGQATPARRKERFSFTISRAITRRWISFVPS
jgi:hypothetical protein